MGTYSFIKASSITHSREVVMERIKKLQPLNYNKFMWWRQFTDNVKPLGKRAELKDRIANREFEPSTYFWQAQYALYQAKDKVNLQTDDHQKQMENLAVDLVRYKRLIEDYEKEESQRMDALYDAFTSAFKLTRSELEEHFIKWSGDIASFYDYAENFLHTTPTTNRKSIRGRPKKMTLPPKLQQPKRGRGRPRKNEMF